MTSPPPTILHLKTTFLTTQTRLLSQPLAPSHAWQTTNSSSDAPLPEKAVDDALFRLNQLLAQHARRVHAPQATRHVAEQIDALYWNAAELAAERDAEALSLTVGHDLTESQAIEELPERWEGERDVEDWPMEAGRYEELVARLRGLNERRGMVQGQVERLRRMRELLEPFGEGVQDNLVTRDGEVEKELERMRMLLARVGGRVGQLLERRGDESTGDLFGEGDGVVVDDVEVEERSKVAELVRTFGRSR